MFFCKRSSYTLMVEIPNNSGYFDIGEMKRYTKAGSAQLVEYIDMYIEESQKDIKQLSILLEEENWPCLELIAHNMKNRSLYMGIKTLGELAGSIEKQVVSNKDRIALKRLIEDFDQIFKKTFVELRTEKDRLKKEAT